MAIWRLVASHHDPEGTANFPEEAIQRYFSEGYIAIGWDATGDLRQYKTLQDLDRAVKAAFPQNKNKGVGAAQLWAFLQEISKGDLVIVSANGRRRGVMRVTGDYEFTAEANPKSHIYRNRRTAELTNLSADKVWKEAGGMGEGQTIYWTLIRCAH